LINNDWVIRMKGLNVNNLMTFKEYDEFNKVSSEEQYRRNVTYYDPMEGWIIDLKRKAKDFKSEQS
jgi:hypothetical protein